MDILLKNTTGAVVFSMECQESVVAFRRKLKLDGARCHFIESGKGSQTVTQIGAAEQNAEAERTGMWVNAGAQHEMSGIIRFTDEHSLKQCELER